LIPGLQGRPKLEVLSELAYYYSFSSNDEYYTYAQEGFEYALSYGDSTYISKFLIELGYYYRLDGSYQESLNKFKRAINISILINDYITLSAAYTGTGSVFFELGRYDKALEFYLKSLEIKERQDDKRSLGVSYTNIGLIYYKIDQPAKALEYHDKSLKYKLAIGDTAGCILNYINIGSAYSEKVEFESDEDKVIRDQNAIKNFRKAIDLSLKYHKSHRLGYAYNGLATVYAENNMYDSAKYYLEISNDESVKNDFRLLESSNYYLLAKIAFLESNINQALDYIQRSQSILEVLKDLNRIKNNYRLYSDIFESQEMLDSAFYYQKKYSSLKDSIFKKELSQNLLNFEIEDATSLKDQEISEKDDTISKTKLIAMFLLSILGLSIALIIIIFRNYSITNKINRQLTESKNKIEAQKENLEKKNEQLADAQITIQKQNDVLKNINTDLDNKVQERTLELDRSNHELEKAVKDLDQFIYKTSHDLRGPIATMQGIINLGVMEAVEDRSKEYFNTLHKVSNNLNNVLFRLIEVHETYQKKPILEKLDPMQEIMETTNRVSHFSIETDITIITELQASGHWNSDKVLFNMIIENMLRSAMLYKDRGESTIKIKTEYKNDQLNIQFEDNGFGIHPGDEDKVFQVFVGKITISVLGTQFNVNATDSITVINIFEGKVRVETADQSLDLQIGEALQIDRTGKMSTKLPSEANDLFWKTGDLIFDSMPLADALLTIGQKYEKVIHLDVPNPENCELTTSFEDAELSDILEVIALTYNLEISETQQVIRLTGPGCE